jgi:hypothetical protein
LAPDDSPVDMTDEENQELYDGNVTLLSGTGREIAAWV